MQYKVDIFSRDECINFTNKKLNSDCVIISINDSGCRTEFKDNERVIDILPLTFDDLTIEIEGFSLFNKSISNEITAFVDTYKATINHFIVHCTAGISRSAAVGFVLTKYLNGDDSHLFKEGRHVPNKMVYEILSNSFGLTYDEKDFDNKLNLKYTIENTSIFKLEFDEDICDIIVN